MALRRRTPLATFIASAAGLGGTLYFADNFDNDSLGLVVIFYLAHWSLGRWSRGLEAWLAVPAVLASIVNFGVTDAMAKAETSPVRGTDGRDATAGWIFLSVISSPT